MPTMTRSTIELPVPEDDRRIARYAAAAIALTVAEAELPSPLPGIKPGLANIIVLVVLLRHGWRDAAWTMISGKLSTASLFSILATSAKW